MTTVQIYYKALQYLSSGDLEEAERLLKEVINLDKHFRDAYLILGGLYLVLESYPEALAVHEKLVKIDPNNLSVWMTAIALYIKVRNFSAAEAFANQMLERFPEGPEGLVMLGLAYYEQGRYEDAWPLLKKALEIDPDISPARHCLLKIMEKQNRFYEGGQFCKKLLVKFPENPDLLRMLGSVLLRMEEYEESNRCFNASLRRPVML